MSLPQETDFHHLRLAKDGLMTLWAELPPEHQATMMLVLLRDLLDTEYEVWVLDAIQRLFIDPKGTDAT